MWEDKLIAGGGAIFVVSLIPSVLQPNTVIPLMTSIPTAATLGVFAYAMLTLKLKWSAISNVATATLWWVLAFKQLFPYV